MLRVMISFWVEKGKGYVILTDWWQRKTWPFPFSTQNDIITLNMFLFFIFNVIWKTNK